MRKTEMKKAHITLLKTELLFITAAIVLVSFTVGFFAGRTRSVRPLNLETALPVRSAALIPESSPAAENTPVPARISGLKTNINTADIEELMELPNIGETLAGRIIEYRNSKGSFKKPEDLMGVSGIGQKTFDKLKDLITT